MTTDEFTGWLRKGLGRAAVFLQKNDSAPYREALLHACTHLLTYDRQCEDSRAPYLLKLIEIAGDEGFYRDGILSALDGDDEEVDLEQLFQLGGRLGAHAEIKRSMYAAFERRGFANAGFRCAEELVRLDGMEGLFFVAKTFGEVEPGDRPWQFGILIAVLERRDGKHPLPPKLDGFAREWREYEQWLEQRKKPPKPRDPTPDELNSAARELLKETDPQRQAAHLRMFLRRPFPGPIDRLLELARSEHRSVAHRALMVLRNIHDPRVRALGLELMNANLLVRNSEPGDYRVFETALLDTSIDPELYHSLGAGILRFVEAHRSEEAERTLLLLYENVPDAVCRKHAVEHLIAIDRLPVSIREECQFDSESEIRSLIAR